MTEREKMPLGRWYDATFPPELCPHGHEPPARSLA